MPLGTVSREAPWLWVELGVVTVQAEQSAGTGVALRDGAAEGLWSWATCWGLAGVSAPLSAPASPSEEGCVVPDWNSSAELALKIVTCCVSVTPKTLLKIRYWWEAIAFISLCTPVLTGGSCRNLPLQGHGTTVLLQPVQQRVWVAFPLEEALRL